VSGQLPRGLENFKSKYQFFPFMSKKSCWFNDGSATYLLRVKYGLASYLLQVKSVLGSIPGTSRHPDLPEKTSKIFQINDDLSRGRVHHKPLALKNVPFIFCLWIFFFLKIMIEIFYIFNHNYFDTNNCFCYSNLSKI